MFSEHPYRHFLPFAVLALLAWTGGAQAQAPTLKQLGNATYPGIYEQPITLTNGRYAGPPFVSGGASRPTVTLVDTLVAADSTATAVLLVENSGGSGSFVYLAAAVTQNDRLVSATTLLGDRVQVRNLRLNGAEVNVDMVAPDQNGVLQKTRNEYRLEDGTLKLTSTAAQGALAVVDLNGVWYLQEATTNETAPTLKITAEFNNGDVSGFSGCNNYRTMLNDDVGGRVSVSPIAATKKLCPPPITTAEDAYLERLGAVTGFRFAFGRLVLVYGTDANSGELLFDRSHNGQG